MFNLFRKTVLTRTLLFVIADTIFISFSIWLAFFIRFDANIPDQYFPFIYRMMGLAVIFAVPIFYFQGLYSFSWSYVSTSEAISLFKAVTISFIFLSVALLISKYFPYFQNFPRSILFISYLLVFIFCGGIRISKRVYMYSTGYSRMADKEKTLIIGAGDAGE